MNNLLFIGPSKIGTLCEELIADHDEEIGTVLQQLSDNQLKQAEESICVHIAKKCSRKEYEKVKNYNYRNALGDFQDQQNIQSMSMDEYNQQLPADDDEL